MPTMTIKQLGNAIRDRLKEAQAAGTLPDHVAEYGYVRYGVRAAQPKAGPTVNIEITGVEPLIPGYPNLTGEAVDAWRQGAGAALLATVEEIRNGYNPDPPVYGGTTKFGPIFLSARVTGTRTVIGPAPGRVVDVETEVHQDAEPVPTGTQVGLW